MLSIIIITILIILFCFFIMSIGLILNGKSLQGSCGNSIDNPCTCTFLERQKCDKNQFNSSSSNLSD